jgi:hypothetical protein
VALQSTTTPASTTVPETMTTGRFVAMHATEETFIMFASTSGVSATTGVGSNSNIPGVLPADTVLHFRLDGTDTWLHHVASSTAIVRMWIASPE